MSIQNSEKKLHVIYEIARDISSTWYPLPKIMNST